MKKYDEVIAQLYQQFPMFQKYGASAYHPGLDRIREMASRFSHPEQEFKSIHIAGTNGKGSTAHILAASLQEVGLQIGVYSSPHLIDFRERIKINGHLISKPQVIDYYEQIQEKLKDLQPSFFEVTTLMAFLYFRDQKVDVAVIETGLGGRLDATNIISPLLSIITSISLEHQAFLGDTLEAIAKEKGGIIKSETPVLISHQNKALQPVFEKIALEQHAPIHWSNKKTDWNSDLIAQYQQNNISVAYEAIQVLQCHFNISEQHFTQSLLKVRDTTQFIGRYMALHQKPDIIADAGHNVDGLCNTWDSFSNHYPSQKKTIVIGCSNDKNLCAFFEHIPEDVTLVLTSYNQPRSMSVHELEKQITKSIKKITKISDAESTIKHVLNTTNQKDAILITGSVFLIGEIFPIFSQK